MDRQSSRARVAVVGAGVSGLACARRLIDRGWDVRVFDKGRRPAGRISTRRSAGFEFDHGAQYFTAREGRFSREVSAWLREGIVAEWQGRVGVLEDGAVKASKKETARYVGVPGMDAIAHHLAADVDVRSGVRVERLAREAARWRLSSEAGDDLGAFDGVVVALPAPQAVPLLQQPAPRLAGEASTARLRPCWAALVAFPEALSAPLDGAFVHGSPLGWTARNASKPGRPPAETWVLHAAPEWSTQNLERRPEEVLPEMLHAFAEALGRESLPEPAFATAHRWRYALPDPPLETDCLFDGEVRIGACGDWCGGPRVEGAYLSGLSLANRFVT